VGRDPLPPSEHGTYKTVMAHIRQSMAHIRQSYKTVKRTMARVMLTEHENVDRDPLPLSKCGIYKTVRTYKTVGSGPWRGSC